MKSITKLLLPLLFILSFTVVRAQDRWSERMAHSVMARHPGGITSWDYVTGTYLEGIEEVWRLTGDSSYYRYIKGSLDAVVGSGGSISGYDYTEYNIDEIKEGTLVLFLYKNTGEERYRVAAQNIRKQFYEHPRTNEGGFWHKKVYPWQMWLDGLYMGSPFYAEYGRLFEEPEDMDDVVHQITQMEKHGRDENTGLLYHGWDESLSQFWADPVTGQSESFWGRGMGWYAMSIVDVLDYMPLDHPDRDSVIGVFQRMAEAIATYQDPAKKVWWQVLDRGGDVNNYTESSASCMFVYAIAKAARLGYIDPSYKQVAIDGFNGIISEFITENGDGTINLTKTCSTAGLGGTRDGSYEYYTQVALYRTNDGKGEGPFILAASEVEMMDSIYPVAFLMIDSVSLDGIHLGWSKDPLNADSILIERYDGSSTIKLSSVPTGTNTFTDTSKQVPGNRYRYTVRAFSQTDTSRASVPAIHYALNQGNLPLKAIYPTPDSGYSYQDPAKGELNWTAGSGAEYHRVFFGTENPPPFLSEQQETVYTTGELAYDTQYFWKIDEGNSQGVTEGNVWTFRTRLPDTLVAYWTFDEEEGDIVTDHSGFGNNGSIVGMVEGNHAEGILDGALFLDGNEYVRVPHSPTLNFGTGNFSIAFYAKLDPLILSSGEEYRFVLKGSHTENAEEGKTGKRYEVFLNTSSDEIRFAVDDNLVKIRTVVTASSYITGDWVHITAVRNVSGHQLKFYVDGVRRAYQYDNTGIIDQEEDLLIGYSEENPVMLKGYMDELRIYNYSLSEDEINALIIDTGIREITRDNGRQGVIRITGDTSGKTYFTVTMPGEEAMDFVLSDFSGRERIRITLYPDENGVADYSLDKGSFLPGLYVVSARGRRNIASLKYIMF